MLHMPQRTKRHLQNNALLEIYHCWKAYKYSFLNHVSFEPVFYLGGGGEGGRANSLSSRHHQVAEGGDDIRVWKIPWYIFNLNQPTRNSNHSLRLFVRQIFLNRILEFGGIICHLINGQGLAISTRKTSRNWARKFEFYLIIISSKGVLL